MKRRELCQALSLCLGGGLVGAAPFAAMAQSRRAVEFQLLGFVLGIQVPANAAVSDLMPAMGYAAPKIARLNQVRLVTQTMVGGSADIGSADVPTAMSAVEAGARLKVVGKMYDKTSHVLVVNADRIRTIDDFRKPSVRVSVGMQGEVSQLLLATPLLKLGIDPETLTNIEMPGSGSRLSALVSGRIDATYVHFDQVASVAGQGNFKVLIEPWKDFPAWLHEVWVVRSEWLEKPENERALVDLLKANIMAFRKANSDFDWYLEMYRKHASLKGAKDETAANLRPIWQRMRDEIRAWPDDMRFSLAEVQTLMPTYQAAHAVRGTVKAEDVIEPKYAAQALKELG